MFGVCTNDAEITSSSQNSMLPLIEKVIESRTQINFYWQKINITVKVFPIISSKLFIEDFNKVAFNLVNSSESNIKISTYSYWKWAAFCMTLLPARFK